MSEPKPVPTNSAAARADAKLREVGLSFPGTSEEFPWGHRSLKVRKRIFVSLYVGADGLAVSLKLPDSGQEALLLPFTEPTRYGLGSKGWVTARFGVDEVPPLALIAEWIEESYRAIAPKTLVKELDGTPPPSRRRKA